MPCPATGKATCSSARPAARPVATLVERQTRYVLLAPPAATTRADAVADALGASASATLPEHLAKSLTWDQGHEMAAHQRFTVAHRRARSTSATPTAPGSAAATRTPTACCANTCPRAPTSPSTPRPTSTSIAHELNDRPRQTLGLEDPS